MTKTPETTEQMLLAIAKHYGVSVEKVSKIIDAAVDATVDDALAIAAAVAVLRANHTVH